MISIKNAPYTGPYSNSSTKLKSQGPTVEAIKRALGRLGYMTWRPKEYTRVWPKNGALDRGFRKWQQDKGLPADGVYGQQAWKVLRCATVPKGTHKGEYALDDYAQQLIREEWKEEHVPDEDDFRSFLVKFCNIAVGNEDNWHYRMLRPLDVTVEPGAAHVLADCSMFCIQAYNWASRQSGLKVPDPSKQGYSGYGNTDQYLDDHPHVTNDLYQVGDLAHYSGIHTNHVTLCCRKGNTATALFCSHGSEYGPEFHTLHYRTGAMGLRFVCRPPLR